MHRKLWLALALCPTLMASTCIHPAHVRVAPGPRIDEPPAFHFEYRDEPLTYVESFQVTDCLDPRAPSVAWRIVREGQPPADFGPLRIVYGRVPQGYRETAAAQPLAPGGCYDATVEILPPVGVPIRNPAGGETFRLLPNGRIIVGQPAGLFNNPRPFRQLNRAAVGCTRGWRRADTAADSAAVDAWEYEVLDARVSCGWLFTEWPGVVDDPTSTERATLALAGLLVVYVSGGLLLEQIPDVPQ
jgi:hypothetical protein